MPTYIIHTRASVVRSYRVTAPNPEAAVDEVDYGDPGDETDEGENVTDIFEVNGDELKDVPIPENAR